MSKGLGNENPTFLRRFAYFTIGKAANGVCYTRAGTKENQGRLSSQKAMRDYPGGH